MVLYNNTSGISIPNVMYLWLQIAGALIPINYRQNIIQCYPVWPMSVSTLSTILKLKKKSW